MQKPDPQVGMAVKWANPDSKDCNYIEPDRRRLATCVHMYGNDGLVITNLIPVGIPGRGITKLSNWKVMLSKNGVPLGEMERFDWFYLQPIY